MRAWHTSCSAGFGMTTLRRAPAIDVIHVPPTLSQVLRELARTSVFACSIAAAACGGIDPEEFDPIPCESAAATQWIVEDVDSPEEAILVARTAGYQVACEPGEGGIREVEGGYEILATTTTGGCSEEVVEKRHVLFVDRAGRVSDLESEVIRTEDSGACPGRRPPGFLSPRQREPGVAGFLARAATLEAASVDAFVVLSRELRAHGAPARLVRLAARSAADEVRHARAMTALARRRGLEPERPRRVKTPPRSLAGLALDNAAEGCVGETWSALVAVHQARAAADPSVARAMTRIAADELRHAALSWEIGSWVDAKLAASERRAMREARARAAAELGESAGRPVPSALVREAGLPSPETARWLFDRLTKEVWG